MGPLARLRRPRAPISRYDAWLEVNEPNARREALLRAELAAQAELPRITVSGSLREQIYPPAADGDYVAFVHDGDELERDALAEVALALAADPSIDALYTDEDELDAKGRRSNPRFKPDWSPELHGYVGGLLVLRRGVDLQRATRVAHIPRVLYHARTRQTHPVQTPHASDDGPRVAVLVPTRNRPELLRACLDSLRRTTYRNYEVVVVDNESDDPPSAGRVLRIETGGRFDFARLINEAVAAVDAEYVLLLNNDTEIIRPDWLSHLVAHARRDGVGAVGARLLFPDGRVQHAGVTHGLAHGLAGHAFSGIPASEPGYLSLATTTRNCAAVTGACLLVRRDLFLELGGFDGERFPVSYNDVDFCHRVVDSGRRVVYCAEAELVHHEGATRPRNADPQSPAAYRALYGTRTDPYYNPNLSLEHERFPIGTRTLPPRGRHRIRTAICPADLRRHGAAETQLELVLRLRDEGVIDPVVWTTADGPLRALYDAAGIEVVARPPDVELVYACGLGAAAAVAAGLPSVWSVTEPYDGSVSFERVYQVVVDADSTRASWRDAALRHNTITVPNALDVDRFRRTLVPRDTDELVVVELDDLPEDPPWSAAAIAVGRRPTSTYSRPILQAMAAGVPVVAPRFPEIGHEVSGGVNALLVDDPGEVPAALERLRADADERRRLGANGPRVLAALPGFDAYVRAYASLLGEAWLTGRPRPRR